MAILTWKSDLFSRRVWFGFSNVLLKLLTSSECFSQKFDKARTRRDVEFKRLFTAVSFTRKLSGKDSFLKNSNNISCSILFPYSGNGWVLMGVFYSSHQFHPTIKLKLNFLWFAKKKNWKEKNLNFLEQVNRHLVDLFQLMYIIIVSDFYEEGLK